MYMRIRARIAEKRQMNHGKKIWLLFCFFLSSCRGNYEPHADYQSLLAKAAVYDEKENAALPKPTWQDRDAPELIALRERFDFDDACSTNDDWEKAKQVGLWIQGRLHHDGSSGMPKYRDALSLLTAYNRDPSIKGYNCRLLALIYQDCALSLGIKVRVVFLGPKELSNDSRVVCEVFSSRFNKWIFIDPSYCAWFFDEDTPLSAYDLRLLLASGGHLPKVNPDAGYNGGPFDVDYEHYLSKNLYFLGFFAAHQSGYDAGKKTEIYLFPKGEFGMFFPGRKIYNTHNPNQLY